MNDLTCVYYTANVLPEKFAQFTRGKLLDALGDIPLICVSHEPVKDFGENMLVDLPRHHLSIYKQALIGAIAAKTKYIAFAEDDVLYSPEHFKYRPREGKFAYNLGYWNIYTWKPDLYTWKGRRNMHSLVCERTLFIEAMEERFKKYPNGIKDLSIWAEPGKYESHLRVTPRQTETFFTNPPNIVFSHQDALAYGNLGTRKRLGELRAHVIPYWGDAKEIM